MGIRRLALVINKNSLYSSFQIPLIPEKTMTPLEQRATVSLSLIVSLRMLGLMAVLPLFALSASQYAGANPSLIGLALGAYGLTQALLQMPLGMLSDRVGRKPIMTAGLLMLALGSIIAASGHSIIHLMIGRILQGAGAIGSTAIACLADLTQEENRTKAMAILGVSIGFSFFLAMAFGPLLNTWVSLAGIFWLTALLAFAGIFIIYIGLPKLPTQATTQTKEPLYEPLKKVLSHRGLLKLNSGIFLLHAILTASFMGIPVLLQQTLNLASKEQWHIYVPVLFLALVLAFGCISLNEKIKDKKYYNIFLFLISIIILFLSEILFYINFHMPLASTLTSKLLVSLALFLLLTAFSILEAMLPSMASKAAPADNKGTAMGVYSSSQFLGIFIGGVLGGWIYHHYGINNVFLFCAVLSALLYINFICN